MKNSILFTVLFFVAVSQGVHAQQRYTNLHVRDSIHRLLFGASQAEKAELYMQMVRLEWDTLPQQAYRDMEAAMQIANSGNNIPLKGKTRWILGNFLTNCRHFMPAQKSYLEAWKIYNSCGDTVNVMNILLELGRLNRDLESDSLALIFYKKGLNLARSAKNPVYMGKFLNESAVIIQGNGNYKKAGEMYRQALAEFRRAGDKMNERNARIDMVSIYLDQKQYDTALCLYLDLIKNADTDDAGYLGRLYTRTGHIYFQKKDYAKSLLYNQKALYVRQKAKSAVEINSSYINIGGDYYMLGKADSGKYYFDIGLSLAKRYDRRNLIKNAYRHLYVYYQMKGDYKKALDYYKQYISEMSKLKQEKARSNISFLDASQQIQRINEYNKMLVAQHELQEENSKNQKYQFTFVFFLTGLASVIVVVFIFLFLYTRSVRRKKQRLNLYLSNEITEREQTERQAREREQQFRFLSENSDDFITHLDPDLNRVYASPSCRAIYGYEPEEMLKISPEETMHPDYVPFCMEQFQVMLATRSAKQFMYLAKKKTGDFFWAETTLNPLFDPLTGVFKGMIGVTRDIQERKTKELEIMEGTKQKENLLKEIHHRVKNNFAILVSLINMQIAQTRNPELLQSLTNLQLRIRTMALVHEMLYRSQDFENISFADYLKSLASVVAGAYNRRDIELVFQVDETAMDIEASIPLGLVVNEILSNSYKHAFPDGRPGKIWVTFRTDRETDTNCLVIRDNGIGMPEGQSPAEFNRMGSQVIQILCQQIEGKMELVNNHGLSYTICFKSPMK